MAVEATSEAELLRRRDGRHPRRASRARRALLVALALLLAWPPAAWGAAWWLAAGPTRGGTELERADAIAVLAGASTYVERARRAAALYAEGRAPLVVLTNDNLRGGWSRAEERNPLFVERAAEELRRAGVPAERIQIIGEPVAGTFEEATRLREYAAARGLRSLVVVTSAYHSRRALWTLRRVFRESGIAVRLDAAAPGEQSPTPAAWWFYRLGWEMVAFEYIKLVYYRLRYA